jgi:hypothetical protein
MRSVDEQTRPDGNVTLSLATEQLSLDTEPLSFE